MQLLLSRKRRRPPPPSRSRSRRREPSRSRSTPISCSYLVCSVTSSFRNLVKLFLFTYFPFTKAHAYIYIYNSKIMMWLRIFEGDTIEFNWAVKRSLNIIVFTSSLSFCTLDSHLPLLRYKSTMKYHGFRYGSLYFVKNAFTPTLFIIFNVSKTFWNMNTA